MTAAEGEYKTLRERAESAEAETKARVRPRSGFLFADDVNGLQEARAERDAARIAAGAFRSSGGATGTEGQSYEFVCSSMCSYLRTEWPNRTTRAETRMRLLPVVRKLLGLPHAQIESNLE